jgi:hypothetical protein
MLEAAVDEIGVRPTAPREAHQREGHERFTLERILAEEMAVLDLVKARRRPIHALGQRRTHRHTVTRPEASRRERRRVPWLIQPLSAPAAEW